MKPKVGMFDGVNLKNLIYIIKDLKGRYSSEKILIANVANVPKGGLCTF
jgi:hypothetical protein